MYTFQEVKEIFNSFRLNVAPKDLHIELYQLDGRIGAGVTLRISQQGKFHSNYRVDYDTAYEIIEMLYNIYS